MGQSHLPKVEQTTEKDLRSTWGALAGDWVHDWRWYSGDFGSRGLTADLAACQVFSAVTNKGTIHVTYGVGGRDATGQTWQRKVMKGGVENGRGPEDRMWMVFFSLQCV